MIGKVDIEVGVKLGPPWFYKFRKWACRQVWNFSEWSGIGLGCLAPHVFYYMVGAQGKKKVK